MFPFLLFFLFVCLRSRLSHTLNLAWKTLAHVTVVGIVNVSALLWLPMPKLVVKLEFALSGEHRTCVVSLTSIPLNFYLNCRISELMSLMLNQNQWHADVKVMLFFSFITMEKLLIYCLLQLYFVTTITTLETVSGTTSLVAGTAWKPAETNQEIVPNISLLLKVKWRALLLSCRIFLLFWSNLTMTIMYVFSIVFFFLQQITWHRRILLTLMCH